jgi:uncharacterized membrane protein
MGGMMAGMEGEILLWSLLAFALVVTDGIAVARALNTWHSFDLPQIPASDSPAVREAKDALLLRYATGEITWEEYLQGKVELED